MMHPTHRYQVLEPIARGDYATVLRARDHELGRDVAIKQIHDQYLADPRQLDRYWQEAQLLASLQHPHVLTIYDVVRERGWLVLELMRGSLPKLLNGHPIDLKDLRLTLNYTLHALQAIHEHGILHGDVKPGNLLVDRNHRVKLGDFGIARRVKGDDGSVVKGTTKYIAPEVVSEQFGPVGAYSDVYSLGFTAYELMCGSHFDTLFPGLNMFGRDPQIAWMMWHSSADRRLPDVQRVLEGVPDDLAYIIQRMTEKNPSRRYRSASEVLADLKLEDGPVPAGAPPSAAAAPAAADPRRRALLVGAAAFGIVATVGMLMVPSGSSSPKKTPGTGVGQKPRAGIVADVDLAGQVFFVAPRAGEPSTGVMVAPERDRFFVNEERTSFNELRRGDHVKIEYLLRDGKEFREVYVTRDNATEEQGAIVAVQAADNTVTFTNLSREYQRALTVDSASELLLNDQPTAVNELRPGDEVAVRYRPTEGGGWKALQVRAYRSVVVCGYVVEVGDDQLKFRQANRFDAAGARDRMWKLDADLVVTVNDKPVGVTGANAARELQVGDRVVLRADRAVRHIDTLRGPKVEGRLTDFDPAQRAITLDVNGQRQRLAADPNCLVQRHADQAGLTWESLRNGDWLTIERRSLDPANRQAAVISVVRQ